MHCEQDLRRAKELADVKVMLHCCGGVQPLLRDLIDAGLDAINPVQISSRGMDAETLKRESARLRKRFQIVKDRLVELGRKEGLFNR